jgi:hypothetical protein
VNGTILIAAGVLGVIICSLILCMALVSIYIRHNRKRRNKMK